MTNPEIRPLELRDLREIEEIERDSYPTPWSRSMFASELSKPSSLCIGAFEADSGRLVGYLVISRYVDAWHVMNIAVRPALAPGALPVIDAGRRRSPAERQGRRQRARAASRRRRPGARARTPARGQLRDRAATR